MMLLSWCLLNLFSFAGDVLPMLSNRTITQRFSLVLRFESLTFYLLFQQWIFLQWSGAVFYARTEYLLCQGQGVLPLNSNRTTKQRFTIVLRHKFLILDLKQIVFAVFYDVRVQFAHAYWVLFFIFIRLNVFFPNELKQFNRPTIFPCFFNLNPPL